MKMSPDLNQNEIKKKERKEKKEKKRKLERRKEKKTRKTSRERKCAVPNLNLRTTPS